jgi:protein-tyrosine-phosphatase
MNPGVTVESAGTHAYYKIMDVTKQYLETQSAIQYLKRVPEGVEGKRLDEYDLIVTMNPIHKRVILNICPNCAGRVQVWDIEDPYGFPPEQAERIYDQIRQKVKELTKTINQ